jgi:hypothetical protein
MLCTMNKKDLNKHWSDQIVKHADKPEPESTDPRKQKIWHKREDLKPATRVAREVTEDK